jgi:ribosomal protein S18 acetylase RimI-like enzyme
MGEYFLVAEEEGRIVGFVMGEIRPCTNNDAVDGAFEGQPERYLEIQDLYIGPSHRGQGIGTQLMRRIVGAAEAKGLGCSLVYSANMDYVRIAKFYEKCGFRMWHVYMTREI